MYFIVSCLFNLGWILIELMVRQGHEQCGSGPSLSLNKKIIMFYSLALSKKLSLIHGNFLTYQDVLHVAHDLFGSPRSFLFTYIFFFKYIESYNHLDIKMKFHHMIRLMAFQCLKWTVAQSPNATNILFGRPKAAPN